MAVRLRDGSIRCDDGTIIYANSLINAKCLLEILPLISPPQMGFTGFGRGGGGGGFGGPGGGGGGSPGPQGLQGLQGVTGLQGPPGPINLVQDEGVNLPVQNTLNFIGSGVSAVDNPGAGATDITINDLYAATRIVSTDPAQGTDLTIQAAINNLPAFGGKIFVKDPQIVSSSIVAALKPINIEFAEGATITATGLGANPLFLLPDGLAAKADFILVNPICIGTNVAGQFFLAVADVNSRWFTTIHNPNITLFRNVFDIRAGDLVYIVPVEIHVFGGQIIPPGAGTGTLAKSPADAGTYAFGMSLFMDDVFGGQFALTSWSIDFDGEIILKGCGLNVSGANKCNGLSATATTTIVGMTGSSVDSIIDFGGSYYSSSNISDSFLVQLAVTVKLFAQWSDVDLLKGAKLIVDGPNQQFVNVADFGNVPAPAVSIDVLAGADGCSIASVQLSLGTTALIRTAAQRTRITGCSLQASGAAKTILETGAADYTLVTGCMRIASGGGFTIPGANSLVGADNIG